MSDVKVAKLFRNGGSQAVRLPAEFRFEGDEVYVRRDDATGDVILSTQKEPDPNIWTTFIADRDAHPVSQEELDEIVAERRRERETSKASREAYWDDLFARMDAHRVEDEDLDAFMRERPLNRIIE